MGAIANLKMARADGGVREHYRRGLGTALRHNQVAYGYSATVTALFGIVQREAGGPNVAQCFLFVAGAGIAFAVVNAVITKWFAERLPKEPSEVVALGTALSLLSMGAGLGLGALVASTGSRWVAWPASPLVTSVGFLLLAGLEMAIAGITHDAGGVGGDFDA
jgi:MFS family permease